MRRGASGCCNLALLGAISTLKFTVNAASNFGHLYPVSMILFCTFQKEFCLQNAVYISLIGFFVASVGLNCLSHGTFSAMVSGVPLGPYFHCGVFCGLVSSRFAWCVLLFLYCNVLAHKIHPSSKIFVHI